MINEGTAIWIGEPGDWMPTLNFQLHLPKQKTKTEFMFPILQQAWYDRRTEEIEWRNVPMVK